MRLIKNGGPGRTPGTSKYDANQSALKNAYGAFADLRRELADSKAAIEERTEVLKLFADCTDSQRAWLLLEDYFEKLSLARRDFPGTDWWPRLLEARGKARLEELALLFLRTNRPLPSELTSYASYAKLAEVQALEQESKRIDAIEEWLLPPTPPHLDAPRAHLRVLARLVPSQSHAKLHQLAIEFALFRPRTGEKQRTLTELIELTTRAVHEQELFPPRDWDFIQWLAATYSSSAR
ncbi:MAG: ATP-dependent helicase, partial [Verrucomicrobiae bacterium]|nr:ATP-dependent helicase [Verrucomicrobiae bacterium]